MCSLLADELNTKLENYVADLKIIRIIRLSKREGLIRARLKGASEATGDVLTFLDAHCECSKGWLVPLLARIAENRSNVVMPVIDEISDQNFYYHAVPEPFHRGVFRWRLEFGWKPVPLYEMERRKDETDGIRLVLRESAKHLYNSMSCRRNLLFVCCLYKAWIFLKKYKGISWHFEQEPVVEANVLFGFIN